MHRNSRFYRVMALILALLMFVTSVGLGIDMHYCGSRLKSFSFFGKAKACTMEMKAATDRNCIHADHEGQSPAPAFQKKACCEDRIVQVQFNQDRVAEGPDVLVSKQLQHFVTAFVFAFFQVHPGPVRQLIQYAQYRPPLIRRDIPVLVQSFLL